jgi:hypothetical protein
MKDGFSLVEHLVFSHVRLGGVLLVVISAVHIAVIFFVTVLVLYTCQLLWSFTSDGFRVLLEALIFLVIGVALFGFRGRRFWLNLRLGFNLFLDRCFLWFDLSFNGPLLRCYFRKRLNLLDRFFSDRLTLLFDRLRS